DFHALRSGSGGGESRGRSDFRRLCDFVEMQQDVLRLWRRQSFTRTLCERTHLIPNLTAALLVLSRIEDLNILTTIRAAELQLDHVVHLTRNASASANLRLEGLRRGNLHAARLKPVVARIGFSPTEFAEPTLTQFSRLIPRLPQTGLRRILRRRRAEIDRRFERLRIATSLPQLHH